MLLNKPEIILEPELSEISSTGYGVSKLDGTEHIFGISSETNDIMKNVMPDSFSYRDSMPKIDNQGELPWCVAYSFSAILNCLLNINKRTDNLDYGIDEEKIYSLRKDKTINGMFPKTAFSEAVHRGIPIESLNENLHIKGYAWTGTIESMKAALLLNGPLLAGITVRDFDRNDFWRGYGYHGGHAIVISGYDDKTRSLELRNSWGTLYGDKGYYKISYDDALKEFLECWTVYL